MKAKKLIIAIGLIALIIVFIFIPLNHTKKITIKAQLYDVAKQINDLNNWKKWNQDFNNSNIKILGSYNTDQTATLNSNQNYLLHHINPLTVSLIKNPDDASTASVIIIAPSINDSITQILWTEKVTAYKMLEQSFTKTDSRQNSLDNLKKLMEDVNYKYGFLIRIVPVKDTLILTAQVSLNDSVNATANLYRMLQTFIKQNNLPAETKYFYTTQLSNKKIAVGIPVYKQAANQDNIQFLQLPGNGRLVVGDYTGSYSGKQKLYEAINNFMLDQHLKQVAQPLEQYNVADTILQPNKTVNLKVFYPVF